MSTSINLLDQNSNVNDADIMVFEPSLLFSPAAVWGEIDDLVRKAFLIDLMLLVEDGSNI